MFKYKYNTMVFLMLISPVFTIAQNQYMVKSNVKITLKSDDSIVSEIKELGVIILNDNVNEFTAKFSLSSLTNHLISYDSSDIDKNRLVLNYRGKFPVSNFVFYENKNDTRNYNMDGSITLNGITNPYAITFNVNTVESTVYLDPDLCLIYCYDYFPVRIFFIISLNPEDFGLNSINKIKNKQVFIEVNGGLINKIY